MPVIVVPFVVYAVIPLSSEESSDGEASPPNSARKSVSSIDRPSSSSKSKNTGPDSASEASDENKQV